MVKFGGITIPLVLNASLRVGMGVALICERRSVRVFIIKNTNLSGMGNDV